MELTAPQQPIDLQLAAVRSAGQAEHAETVRSLLEAYSQFTPQVQVGLLDVVFSRQAYLVVLLDAMEAGTVRRNCLDAARRERLTASRDAEIAARRSGSWPMRRGRPIDNRCSNATRWPSRSSAIPAAVRRSSNGNAPSATSLADRVMKWDRIC